VATSLPQAGFKLTTERNAGEKRTFGRSFRRVSITTLSARVELYSTIRGFAKSSRKALSAFANSGRGKIILGSVTMAALTAVDRGVRWRREERSAVTHADARTPRTNHSDLLEYPLRDFEFTSRSGSPSAILPTRS